MTSFEGTTEVLAKLHHAGRAVVKHDSVTLVFGASGAGKTTLIAALMGASLRCQHDPDGLVLVVDDDDHDVVRIGHGVAVGTTVGALYTDASSGEKYYDTCGLLDPREGMDEVLNTFALASIMRSGARVRILLVASEAALRRDGTFLRVLAQLAAMVPSDHDLQDSIGLVVTHFTHMALTDKLAALTGTPPGANAALDLPGVRSILCFLHAHATTRVGVLPMPTAPGPYDADGDVASTLRSLVQAIPGAHTPRVVVALSATAKEATRQVALGLAAAVLASADSWAANAISAWHHKVAQAQQAGPTPTAVLDDIGALVHKAVATKDDTDPGPWPHRLLDACSGPGGLASCVRDATHIANACTDLTLLNQLTNGAAGDAEEHLAPAALRLTEHADTLHQAWAAYERLRTPPCVFKKRTFHRVQEDSIGPGPGKGRGGPTSMATGYAELPTDDHVIVNRGVNGRNNFRIWRYNVCTYEVTYLGAEPRSVLRAEYESTSVVPAQVIISFPGEVKFHTEAALMTPFEDFASMVHRLAPKPLIDAVIECVDREHGIVRLNTDVPLRIALTAAISRASPLYVSVYTS